jgi:signal transduction histidine kinase/ligand-binding sensor domain-containing protein
LRENDGIGMLVRRHAACQAKSYVWSRTWLAPLILGIMWGSTAYGLDPNRKLTQYVHRIWQVQQGLPESSIYSILQARDGFLWLGTQAGLVRFDGVDFTPLENIYPNAPTNVWIRDVLEDASGALWIATNESGVFRLADGEFTHFTQKEGLPSDTVLDVQAGRNGDIWFCTPNGLARFSDGAFQVFNSAQGLSSTLVRAAMMAHDGTIWIGDDSPRVRTWNGSKFTTRKLTSLPADAVVRALASFSDGTVWIGTNVGLVQLKDGKERLWTVKDGLADNWILSLAEGHNGSLFIATRNGFSRLRSGEIDSFRPQDGLSQSSVFSLFEDREGSLWVGTKHGLNQFLDGRGVPYTVTEGLPTNDSGPVVQDQHGNTWIGTLGAGLSRFDGKKFTVLTTRDNLSSNSINTLVDQPDGSLWVGTNRGLNRWREGHVDHAYTSTQGLPSNDIRCLFLDRQRVLWVGTAAGAVQFRDGHFVRPPGLSITEPILAIGEDHNGRIYLATANDVTVYASGKSSDLLQNGSPLRGVDAFYRDREGLFWMGLIGGGLRLVEDNKISSFFMRDGLFDNEIFAIVGDDQDRLWMACSKGIYSVPRAELRRFAADQLKKITSLPYSPTDALRVIECKEGVQPSASVAQDGRLWFSTIRGLIVLDPKHLQRNVPPPPVAIEEVTVNGETEQPNRIEELAPGRKNLEFRYTGLSFLNPTRITFRYMLEGFDKNWIDAGTRREAFYTNLPPGKFRFRVTACNVDGVCNDSGGSVGFTLQSHYYQRIWFFPLFVVIIGAASWLAYQLRIRHLREQFHLILTERNRIARELHDTLIQGLSGITMEMQALAGRVTSPKERGTLEEIIQDAGTCLRETRRSVAGLRSANSGLAAAIEQAARQLTETKDIRLKLNLEKTPAGLAPDVEYNLVRIAQEAVTNSVKHSGARNVEVALNYNSKAVHLSVKDDGAGFAENGKTGHYGLIGMKERATHIGAGFELASTPGRGTLISVVLPSGQNGNHNGLQVGQNGKHDD